MIDILFLAHNRRAFTEASLEALKVNTDWSLVGRVFLYDDNSTDGTMDLIKGSGLPVETIKLRSNCGSPVAIMNDYLTKYAADRDGMFAKIDSDTMVPPGWLNACIQVMGDYPDIDLLGIEAHMPLVTCPTPRTGEPAVHIGGIGLMRQAAFTTLPVPNGRFGFTAWQAKSEVVHPAWISPSIPVFLLDKLPRDPWQRLSAEYVRAGWQRESDDYPEERKALWAWWCE